MLGKSMPVDLDHVKPFMGFCTALMCRKQYIYLNIILRKWPMNGYLWEANAQKGPEGRNFLLTLRLWSQKLSTVAKLPSWSLAASITAKCSTWHLVTRRFLKRNSDARACNTVTLLALSLLSSGCFSWVWWVVKRLEHNMQKCDPWILQPSKHSWEKCYLHPSDHSGTVCIFALWLQIKLLSPHLSCLASLNSWYVLNRSKWVQYGAM